MKKVNHILLVDDDDIANHLHKLLIEDMAIAENIEVATDGEEALDIIKNKFNTNAKKLSMLALIDINMPGMDAFEFLNEYETIAQNLPHKIHIILLSSSSNPRDKEKARRYDISGYMVKPLTEEKLLKIVKSM